MPGLFRYKEDNQERVVIQQVKKLLDFQKATAEGDHGKSIHADKDADCNGHQQQGIVNWLFLLHFLHPLAAAAFLLERILFIKAVMRSLITGEPAQTIRIITIALYAFTFTGATFMA